MKAIKMLMMAALTIVSVSLFAQDSTKQKSKTQKQKMEMMKYSCPMHPDVTSKKPGKCTKCGMDMTKSKKRTDENGSDENVHMSHAPRCNQRQAR